MIKKFLLAKTKNKIWFIFTCRMWETALLETQRGVNVK